MAGLNDLFCIYNALECFWHYLSNSSRKMIRLTSVQSFCSITSLQQKHKLHGLLCFSSSTSNRLANNIPDSFEILDQMQSSGRDLSNLTYPTLNIDTGLLYLQDAGDGCGWSLRCRSVIPKSTSVCAYLGEYINTKTARLRHRMYEQQAWDINGSDSCCNYILTIREHTRRPDKSQTNHSCAATKTEVLHDERAGDDDNHVIITNVDATTCGNVARFINHSCDPNLELCMHRGLTHPLLGIPYVKSMHTIPISEQLTFDYAWDETTSPSRSSGTHTSNSSSGMDTQGLLGGCGGTDKVADSVPTSSSPVVVVRSTMISNNTNTMMTCAVDSSSSSSSIISSIGSEKILQVKRSRSPDVVVVLEIEKKKQEAAHASGNIRKRRKLCMCKAATCRVYLPSCDDEVAY